MSNKNSTNKLTVFISYSHVDEKEKDKLLSHLGVLQAANLLDLWSDDHISPGGNWEQEIKESIDRAKVAILLITDKFLSSDSSLQEVRRLLERRSTEGLIVFPVIARHCAWEQVEWLAKMNVMPEDRQPIWRAGDQDADQYLADIARKVVSVINKMEPVPHGPIVTNKRPRRLILGLIIFLVMILVMAGGIYRYLLFSFIPQFQVQIQDQSSILVVNDGSIINLAPGKSATITASLPFHTINRCKWFTASGYEHIDGPECNYAYPAQDSPGRDLLVVQIYQDEQWLAQASLNIEIKK